MLVEGWEPLNLRQTPTINIERMRAGENRWIGIRFSGLIENGAALVSIDELHGDVAINGFALGLRVQSRRARRHLVERWRSVVTRVAYGWGGDPERELRRLIGRADSPPTAESLSRLLAAMPSDKAGPLDAIAYGERFLRGRTQPNRTLLSVLESIDAALTALQLAPGDSADIAQTFRRQEFQFSEAASQDAAAAELGGVARSFEEGFARRDLHPADAPRMLLTCASAFECIGDAQGVRGLGAEIEAVCDGTHSLDAVQHTHANVLDRLS